MDQNFMFKVCRGCLAPQRITELSSLFDEKTKNWEKLILISGVDLKSDIENNNEALICKDCLVKLEIAFNFGESVQKLEVGYFMNAREQKAVLEETMMNNYDDYTCKYNLNGSLKPESSQVTEGQEQEQVVDMEIEENSEENSDENLIKKFNLKEFQVNVFRMNMDYVEENSEEEQHETSGNVKSPKTPSSNLASILNKKGKRIIYDKTPTPTTRNRRKSSVVATSVKKEEKRIVCKFEGCGKICKYEESYERHRAMHLVPLPFGCHCGLAYMSQRTLKRHQQQKHMPEKNLEI